MDEVCKKNPNAEERPTSIEKTYNDVRPYTERLWPWA